MFWCFKVVLKFIFLGFWILNFNFIGNVFCLIICWGDKWGYVVEFLLCCDDLIVIEWFSWFGIMLMYFGFNFFFNDVFRSVKNIFLLLLFLMFWLVFLKFWFWLGRFLFFILKFCFVVMFIIDLGVILFVVLFLLVLFVRYFFLIFRFGGLIMIFFFGFYICEEIFLCGFDCSIVDFWDFVFFIVR